jgi:Tfp pilus assembly protein PilX
MAKSLSAAEIAAALQEMGLTIPDELQAKVQNSKADAAEVEIASHLSESDEKKLVAAAEAWRTDLFALSTKVAAEFKGQEKNVGQGRVFERYVEIETPDGAKFMIRHREPREKK